MKDTILLSAVNPFIAIAEEFYDLIILDNSEYIEKVIETSSTEGFLYKLFNSKKEVKEEKSNPEIQKLIELKHEIISKIESNGSSFDMIWHFCQFLKWSEKVIFYPNNISNNIYTESDIDDVDIRELILRTPKNQTVYLKLEKKDLPDINISDLNKVNCITVSIGPEFKIVVVNGKAQFKDDSDVYMVQTVNQLIISNMLRVTFEVLDNIHNKTFLNYNDQNLFQ